jgi:hypothetical protein
VTPYDGSVPWAGPHATFKAALIEWIKKETFNNKPNGFFIVDESGVVRPGYQYLNFREFLFYDVQ